MSTKVHHDSTVPRTGGAGEKIARKASFRMSSIKSFDSSSLASSLEKMTSNETETPLMEVVRLRLKKLVATTFVGKMYVNALLVLSVLSCAQYIYQTYLDEERDKKLLQFFSFLELFLAALFAFDWCLWLFLADHRLEQFLSFFAMVDFTTVIPIWLTYFVFTNPVEYGSISNFDDAMNYFLRGMYTLRILRALRVHRVLIYIEDEVTRFLSQMALSIITMILFDAAIMQYLEVHEQNFEFHTWMYFLVVSISTVGYGDISPISTLGRFCAMFFICFAIVFVPQQSNELIEKMNRSSVYARMHYKARGNTKHVLICGDLHSTSMQEFFTELFHEDHENLNLHAVIMQPELPNKEIYSILRDPIYSITVHYLDGSPLNDSDLIRAKAEQAIAIFLMGNKFSINADEEDAKTILQHFSIRRYIRSKSMVDPLFCLQLIRPENRRHLAIEDPDADKELVVCLNEMKMGIIAKTCMYPGTSTLIFNLLISFADGGDDDDNSKSMKSKEDADSSESSDSEDAENDDQWLVEYQKGCDWEIYTTEMASVFEGARFIELAQSLYSKLGVVLFALKIRELQGKNIVRVLLNPSDYVIPSKDKCFVEGFVMAKNKQSSDLSFTGSESGESSQLSLIANAISKTAEASASSIRRQSMAISRGTNNRGGKVGAIKPSGWQSVMSTIEAPEIEENKQEQLQRLEDEQLRNNFFVRDSPADLMDAHVATSLLEEYPYMNNHMIVIAKGLSNLYDFIRPLRAKHLGKLCHIVLLYPDEIPAHIWRRISLFEGILYVKGSPLEESDIRRAGIFRASQVVVLADPNVETSKKDSSRIDALVDADAIFTYHCVRRLNEKTQVMIEIVRHQNVIYLDPSVTSITSAGSNFKFTAQFASGLLFTSSMLDTIVCQAFYNPQIIRVLNKLISGTEHAVDTPKSNPLLSSGRRPIVGIGSVVGSALYQISVPDNLTVKTYGAMFRQLTKEGILPLGLLRGVFQNMSMGPRANKMPYVFTNPHKDTELYLCDRVFVLSQKVLNNSKLSAKEVFENFMHATQTDKVPGRRRANTGMGAGGIENAQGMDSIREEFQDVTTSQRALERSMTSLSVDLTRKMEEMKKMMAGGVAQPQEDQKKNRRMSSLLSNNTVAKNSLRAAVNRAMSSGSSSPARPSAMMQQNELSKDSSKSVLTDEDDDASDD